MCLDVDDDTYELIDSGSQRAVEPHTEYGADGRPKTFRLAGDGWECQAYPTDMAWFVVPEPSAEGATA